MCLGLGVCMCVWGSEWGRCEGVAAVPATPEACIPSNRANTRLIHVEGSSECGATARI